MRSVMYKACVTACAVSYDETVAKMGHPVVVARSDVGHPSEEGRPRSRWFGQIWATRPLKDMILKCCSKESRKSDGLRCSRVYKER